MTPAFLNKIAVRLGLTRNDKTDYYRMGGLLPWTEKMETEFIYPLSGSEQKMKYESIPYNKEAVEHLTDQLIKLQRAYDSTNQLNARVGLNKAMDTINDSLKMLLKPQAVIKLNGMD